MRNQHDQPASPASAGSILGIVGRYGAPRIHLDNEPPPPALPATPPAVPPATPSSPGAPPPSPGSKPPADGPQAYRPEGLPDHLFGKSDKETIEKLHGAVNGFRKQQGDAGAVPEKPDGYKFEPSDKLKPYVENFDKDPVFAKTREIFHKAGITDKQFNGALGPLLESLVDGGLVAAPIDAKAMLRNLAPADIGADATDADREVAGGRRVQDNIAWADGAKANKAIPDDIADYLVAGAADNPAANKLIEWLRGSNSEMKPAMGGAGGAGLTDAAMTARITDPRGDPRSNTYDPAFAAETDRLSKQHYGN